MSSICSKCEYTRTHARTHSRTAPAALWQLLVTQQYTPHRGGHLLARGGVTLDKTPTLYMGYPWLQWQPYLMVATSRSNVFNSWPLLSKYFFTPLTLQWYLVWTSSEWTLQFWAAQDQVAVVRADCWCCLRSLRCCSCCPYVVIRASTLFCLWPLVAQTNCVFLNQSVCMFQFQKNIRFLTFLTSYLIFVLDSQTKNSGDEGLWSDVVLMGRLRRFRLVLSSCCRCSV